MRKYIWIVHVFYSARSESTHTSQATVGNKRVTADICTTHKHEWLFKTLIPSSGTCCQTKGKKNCCLPSVWLQESSLHRPSFRNHRKQRAWPTAMRRHRFSCTSCNAKELAWVLRGAVLLSQQLHCHGWDGVIMLLPVGFLWGTEEQDDSVGQCTPGGISNSTGS